MMRCPVLVVVAVAAAADAREFGTLGSLGHSHQHKFQRRPVRPHSAGAAHSSGAVLALVDGRSCLVLVPVASHLMAQSGPRPLGD